MVDIFEQTRNRVRLRAVGIGYAPEYVGSRQAVPLHRQAKPHVDTSSGMWLRQVEAAWPTTFGDGAWPMTMHARAARLFWI